MSFNQLNSQHTKKDPYAYIRALMRYHGITGKKIARKLRVSEACVSIILHGKERSRRVQEAIAAALNEKPEDLWPA